MRKIENREHVAGYVYSHKLTIKQVQNKDSKNFGKNFISGDIEVATDEQGMNIVPVHFTYVTEVTSKGAKNNTYTALQKIIEAEGKTWTTGGKENAIKVSIDTALALNDYINSDGERVSLMRNEGGFVTIVNLLEEEEKRNTFKTDMVISNVRRVNANPENGINEDYCVVSGAVFNFRNALLPVSYVIRKEKGMEYFEDLGVTNASPVFLKVHGHIINTTQVIEKEEEVSDWSEVIVQSSTRRNREWVISGTAKLPFDFGEDGEDLTTEELKAAMQDREVYWSEIKRRNDEYLASRQAEAAASEMVFSTNF